jgi:hypothetical protein
VIILYKAEKKYLHLNFLHPIIKNGLKGEIRNAIKELMMKDMVAH